MYLTRVPTFQPVLRRWALRALAASVLALCLYYFAARFPWAGALAALGRLNVLVFVFASAPVILAVWALRAVRFQAVVRAHGGALNFRDAYFTTAAALGLAAVTPLQAGEALKFAAVRNTPGFTLPRLAGLMLRERLVDLFTLACFTLCATGWIGLAPPSLTPWLIAAGLFPLAVWAALALAPLKLPEAVGALAFVGAQTWRARATILFTTLACWSLSALLWAVALIALGIMLAPAQAVALTGLVTFAGVASAAPGGLGVNEVSSALLLERFGVESVLAHAGALALRASTLLVIALAAPHAWFLQRAKRMAAAE